MPPFWSLSYEVWFYIVLGALALLIKQKNDNKKFICFIALVASISVFVCGLKMHYLLIWIMGAIAYMFRPKKKNKLVLLLSFVGFLGSVLYWQFSKDTKSLEIAIEGTNKEFLELLMSLMVCLFIQQAILFEPKKAFVKSIEKIIGGMAKFSYTLYLSHKIVFLWIVAFVWPENSCQFTTVGLLRYLAIVISTLVICWSFYLFSECYSPAIKRALKHRLLKV